MNITLSIIVFGSIIFGALLTKVPNNKLGFILMIVVPLTAFSVLFLADSYLFPYESEYSGAPMAELGVLFATLLSIVVSFISLCVFAWLRDYLKSKNAKKS